MVLLSWSRSRAIPSEVTYFAALRSLSMPSLLDRKVTASSMLDSILLLPFEEDLLEDFIFSLSVRVEINLKLFNENKLFPLKAPQTGEREREREREKK
mmetsp:Transcript_3442/g.5804  ORF Transcript_3442/g.5804 Transcript_3442/m.5804 type:complete len:98 (+) Transcript_3442:332-625(+)